MFAFIYPLRYKLNTLEIKVTETHKSLDLRYKNLKTEIFGVKEILHKNLGLRVFCFIDKLNALRNLSLIK